MKRKVFFALLSIWIAVSLLLIALGDPAQAQQSTTIYFTNFNTGYSDWTASGDVASVSSPAIQPNSVRLKKVGTITRTISTLGYTGISVTWNMAASALEDPDHCYVEVNTGSGWTAIASLGNGQDNSTFFSGTVSLGAAADQNPSFQVRYRDAGDALGDYCYAEDLTVSGTPASAPTDTPTPTSTPAGPTPTPIPGSTVPGDPLTGSGDVLRTLLTYNDLMSGSSTAPVDDSAFALPVAAAIPTHTFEGRLELFNEAMNGGFTEIRDDYAYTGNGDSPRKHLPEFSFQFVQNGSHLIPVNQGLSYTGHPYWNYIVGPGRIWKENSDNGYSRISIPFALIQRNSNCTHNGVMTFLFNGSSVSNVRYQITQETCVYFKFNMWGHLSAAYTAETIPNAATLKSNHAIEVANHLPTKPIAELATDFPASGVDVAAFGSSVTPAHMTNYGVVINGTNYVSGCGTRYGQYAYCGSMRVPSYSTAKSAFASLALMRLGQLYGAAVNNLLIKDYVPEYSSSVGTWTTVTFGHAIDMTTGNYRLAGYESDEAGSYMETFFLAEPYTDKITAAFNFPNKKLPGQLWIYHSSDTFIVTRAMNNYYIAQSGEDIFNMVRDQVYVPLNLSAGTLTTLRTDNDPSGVPFGGYGLFWTQDDIAKVALLLNNQNGVINGSQVLNPDMLADAMQDDATDRGMNTTGATVFKYNNAFWAKEMTPSEFPQYSCTFWVPFMSGYGGITVAMLPNGATYYYFSDNEEYSWYNAVHEANKLAPMCP